MHEIKHGIIVTEMQLLCIRRLDILPHWGRDKITAISQTTFSNAFSIKENVGIPIKISLKRVSRSLIKIFQYWCRQWLGAGQKNSHYLDQCWLDYRRIYASPGLNEIVSSWSQIARFMGPIWGPPGSCRPQMGPMLAPWTLLSGIVFRSCYTHNFSSAVIDAAHCGLRLVSTRSPLTSPEHINKHMFHTEM